jgi:hypothetical protein
MMKKILPTLVALVIISLPLVVFAATDCPGAPDGGLANPTNYCSLDAFLAGVLHAVVLIAFPIIVLFLVYIGWLFIYQGNNPQELSKVRTYFIWAIVGALIVLGAEALSRAIGATVNAISGNPSGGI